MGLLVFWGICGIAAAVIASSKGRDMGAWFVGGLLLGPIGVIIVVCLGAVDFDAEDRRPCPYCAEQIKLVATVCHFCGREVPSVNPDKAICG